MYPELDYSDLSKWANENKENIIKNGNLSKAYIGWIFKIPSKFWTNNSVDKPTPEALEKLLTELSFIGQGYYYFNPQINWIDSLTINLVTSEAYEFWMTEINVYRNAINYFVLQTVDVYYDNQYDEFSFELNKTTFWEVEEIEKVMSNSIAVIRFKKDIFFSDAIAYFHAAKVGLIPFHVNRSSVKEVFNNRTKEVCHLLDPLLPPPNKIKYFNLIDTRENIYNIPIGAKRLGDGVSTNLYNKLVKLNVKMFDAKNNKFVELTEPTKPLNPHWTNYFHYKVGLAQFDKNCDYFIPSAIYCDVYLLNSGEYLIVPLISRNIYNSDNSDNIKFTSPSIKFKSGKFFSADYFATDGTSSYSCDLQGLTKLRENLDLINKFKGTFLFNNFHIAMLNMKICFINNFEWCAFKYSCAFLLDAGIFNATRDIYFNRLDTPDYYKVTIRGEDWVNYKTITTYNSSYLNPYIATMLSSDKIHNFFEQTLVNNANTNNRIEIKAIKTEHLFYTFNETMGLTWYWYDSSINIQPLKIEPLKTIPVNLDSYKAYLAGVSNTQNTGIQIAKQNMQMGIANAAFNIAMGVNNNIQQLQSDIAGVMTGDANGGNIVNKFMFNTANTLFKGGMDIAKNILTYKNTKRQIEAINRDNAAKMCGISINSSVSEEEMKHITTFTDDIIVNTRNFNQYRIDYISSMQLYCYDGSKQYIQSLNKIFLESGYYIDTFYPQFEKLGEQTNWLFEDNKRAYCYIDVTFDEKYIDNIQQEWITDRLTREMCKLVINQPIRFWKNLDYYTTQLEYNNDI